ncbi:restriction endonuclease subunit S [Constantimarinum furrinae]|uniref:Type I restriction modification DNA specificity domain protein n=1 Tax=Constantimarinum furrinae TaxID=2562285 RepID=A0A7G8PRS8_9FLAO|nr:restriction endonuclease subunit S [Constantimarinum furrinae]QNJ97044.1 Type I restriction modification DNA specificity domain protein [Constantimarinum furrinae]
MELTEVEKLNLQQTELGKIPEDWIASTFGETFTGFSSGMTPYRGIPEYYTGNIPWITSGELNYNIITDTWEKITEDAVAKTNLKVHPVGTFLMAITGLEAAGTRGSCAITGIRATTNQSCMALFPIKGKTITEYLYHFYVYYGNELAFKYCQGTKQQSYTGRIAKRLPINLPPSINEQKAITQVLSDTDALIQALEKKIAKKKLIKKGVMQRLLTPKEGWDYVRLGDLSTMNSGGTPLTTNEKYYGGNIVWISISDISEAGKYISNSSKRISEDGLTNSSARLFKSGTVLLAMYASIGKCCIATTEVTTSQAILGINPSNQLINEFLYYYLIFKVEDLISQGQQGTQSNLNKGIVGDYKIHLPQREEQKEIAQILSDMDKEINNLEQKLFKYQLAKQGMMQQLLTGKIRLV